MTTSINRKHQVRRTRTVGRVSVGALAAALVLGPAATSWADPTNGDVWTLTCLDASVAVQLTPGGGNRVWGEDGARYLVKSFDVRIYRGEFATEPDIDPILESSQNFGNRIGQGEATECSFRDYNPAHNATAFIDITMTSKS